MYLDPWTNDGWFPESFDPEPGQSIMGPAVDSAGGRTPGPTRCRCRACTNCSRTTPGTATRRR
jgi:hypothetical protein